MASGATVGTAVIKLSFDGKGVKAELDGISKEMETRGNKTGAIFGNAWSVAAGSLISKGISKIGATISNNLGRAISRVDTINNFPKVMTALGYSADEASSSVNEISNAIDGLPTALDSAVSDIQKLAATMGNLNTGMVNATSVGIALNNMFLAGGKGTEAASNAMGQYNQMLAAGKADMQSWRSILDAAPGQLNQLAKTLLGATATQEDLRQAINDGTISFDQMNEAIVNLNQNGGDGFASFEEQARTATGGIGTALENVQNRIGKAIAKIIDHIGSDKIAEAINNISAGFSGVADVIINIIDFIANNQWLVEFVGTFIGILGGLSAAIWVINAAMAASPITWIIAGISAIIAGIVMLITHIDEVGQWFHDVFGGVVDFLAGVCQNIGDFFGGLWNGLIEGIQNVWNFFTGIFSGIGEFLGNVWNTITSTLGQFIAKFGEFIGGIFKGAINGVLAFIEGFVNLPIDALNGFIGIINGAFGWIGVNIGYIDRIQLPRLAEGGVADSTTTAVIGEDGKEAVIPLENNTDNWAGLLAATLVDEFEESDRQLNTGGVTVYMTNQINNEMDAEDIGRILMQSIRRAA